MLKAAAEELAAAVALALFLACGVVWVGILF